MNDKNNETIHCMATVDVIIIGSWLSKAQRLKKMFNNQCSIFVEWQPYDATGSYLIIEH